MWTEVAADIPESGAARFSGPARADKVCFVYVLSDGSRTVGSMANEALAKLRPMYEKIGARIRRRDIRLVKFIGDDEMEVAESVGLFMRIGVTDE